MPDGAFAHILERYGQSVSVHYGRDAAGVPAKAFVQPVLDRRYHWWQAAPTSLGVVRQDRFLYLGEPGVPLEKLEDGYIQCQGVRYDVQAAQAVYVGKQLSHWWAMLQVRDMEELE